MGSSGKLSLFGGIQHVAGFGGLGQNFGWPSSLWVPIAQQATTNQFPSNWYRDDYSLGGVGYDNDGGGTRPTRLMNHWATIRSWCDANGVNGPCVQLVYPGHDGSFTQGQFLDFLQQISPYCPSGTYQIACNEVLNNQTHQENGNDLLNSFGGPGATGYDGLINCIKFQRANLPAGVLLGLNEFDVCSWDTGTPGDSYNLEECVAVYQKLAQNGAPLDWLGCEGYYMNALPPGFTTGTPEQACAAKVNSVGSRLVTTKGTGAQNTIAFTEWTPYTGPNFYSTQKALYQAYLAMFVSNQYVFGVTTPWSGILRSQAFNSANWLLDDTNNGGTDPDGIATSNGHITPTLVFIQGWAGGNVTGGTGTPPATGPFGGTAPNLPTTIIGSAYDTGGQNFGYNFNMNGGQNVATAYRTDGVQNLKTNTDNFNKATVPWVVGYGVGGTSDATDNWTQYTVNVPVTGTFTFALRCGTNTGGAFHLSIDGTDTPVVNVLAQGAWDTPAEWVTAPVPGTYPMTAGQHILKILINTSNIDVNALLVTEVGVVPISRDLTPQVHNVTTATVKNSLAQLAGNQLLAFVAATNPPGVVPPTPTFSDAANGSNTLIVGPVSHGQTSGWLFSVNNCAARNPNANTGTATFSSAPLGINILWEQIDNQALGSNFDGIGSNSGTSATPSVSVTTTGITTDYTTPPGPPTITMPAPTLSGTVYYLNASGPLGTGDGSSAANAADASTAAKHDAIVSARLHDVTLVYAAGTYLTTGGGSAPNWGCFQPYQNWTLQGAGIDQTIIKLANGTISSTTGSNTAFGIFRLTSHGTLTNVNFKDFTLDLNANNQGFMTTGGASYGINLSLCINCTIQRVKFTHFGAFNNNESFPLLIGNTSSDTGTCHNVTVDSCIFTSPATGNNFGVTCVVMCDTEPNILVDNTCVVTNCQFLDINNTFTGNGLTFAQCVCAPVSSNCYARNVDTFWFVEPGSASSGNNVFFTNLTVQINSNTIVNGAIWRILMHHTGTMAGNLSVLNNTCWIAPWPAFGNNSLGSWIDIYESGGASIGNIVVNNNVFIGPISPPSPPQAMVASTALPNVFTLASLSINNNYCLRFPAGDSGFSQITSGPPYNPNYTNTGNSSSTGLTITTSTDSVFTFGFTYNQFNGAGTGFTNIINDVPNGIISDYQVTSTAGTFTDSPGQPASSDWVMIGAAIKAPGAGVTFGGLAQAKVNATGALTVTTGLSPVVFSGSVRGKVQASGGMLISRFFAGSTHP